MNKNKKLSAIFFVIIVIFSMVFLSFTFMNKNSQVSALPSNEWWNANWEYRREIKITNNLDEHLTDVPVLLELTASEFIGKADDSGKDIAIIAADQETEFYFWIEIWEEPGQSINRIWVKIPELFPYTSTYIFLYYGNENPVYGSGPENPYNNGKNVFIAWDDFEIYPDGYENLGSEIGWVDTSNEEARIVELLSNNKVLEVERKSPTDRDSITYEWNVDFECKVNFDLYVDDKEGSYLGYMYAYESTGTNIAFIKGQNSDDWYWYDGNSLHLFDPGMEWPFQEWKEYEFIIANNELNCNDGTLHNGGFRNNYFVGIDTWRWQAHASFNSRFYIDNFYVRKFLSQEPGVTYGYEEEYQYCNDLSYGDYIVDEQLLQFYGLIDENNEPLIHKNYDGEGITILMIDNAVDYRNEYFWDSADECRIVKRALFRDMKSSPYDPEEEDDNYEYNFEDVTSDLEDKDHELLNQYADLSGDYRIINPNYDHGTWVAGIIRQIAPKADIISVGLIEDEISGISALVAASNTLNWIWDQIISGEISPDIVTLSIGATKRQYDDYINNYDNFDPDDFKIFIKNLSNRGIMFTVGAGNRPKIPPFEDIEERGTICFPARLEANELIDEIYPGFIPIAASDYNYKFGYDDSFGLQFVYDSGSQGDIDITACGGDFTTIDTYYSLPRNDDGWYTTTLDVGTSFATPIVAGTLALIKQYFRMRVEPYYSFTPKIAEAMLFSTTTPGASTNMNGESLDNPHSMYYGHGCLDIEEIFKDTDQDGFVDCLEEILGLEYFDDFEHFNLNEDSSYITSTKTVDGINFLYNGEGPDNSYVTERYLQTFEDCIGDFYIEITFDTDVEVDDIWYTFFEIGYQGANQFNQKAAIKTIDHWSGCYGYYQSYGPNEGWITHGTQGVVADEKNNKMIIKREKGKLICEIIDSYSGKHYIQDHGYLFETINSIRLSFKHHTDYWLGTSKVSYYDLVALINNKYFVDDFSDFWMNLDGSIDYTNLIDSITFTYNGGGGTPSYPYTRDNLIHNSYDCTGDFYVEVTFDSSVEKWDIWYIYLDVGYYDEGTSSYYRKAKIRTIDHWAYNWGYYQTYGPTSNHQHGTQGVVGATETGNRLIIKRENGILICEIIDSNSGVHYIQNYGVYSGTINAISLDFMSHNFYYSGVSSVQFYNLYASFEI